MKRRILRNAALVGVFAFSIAISACSSDDDDENSSGDDTSGENPAEENPNLSTAEVTLDSASTVPMAVGAEDAMGEGSISVDTVTGEVSGSVTVSGTTGVPNAAHIHAGAVGSNMPGTILIPLETADDGDGTVWTVSEDDNILSADEIALFEAGETYVNVHTEANPTGEVRGQLVPPEPDTVTISFVNTSATMPMTLPVVALHNAPTADNGVRLFEVDQPAIPEVIAIAEDGDNDPLVALAGELAEAGSVTAAGVAAPEVEGAMAMGPGTSSSITLDLANEEQVLSIVSMIVCSNDGFSGIDSRELSADATETFTAPIYDAGSESNVETLDYWVPPCGTETNLGDEENGSIMAHPGQAVAENPDFNFEAGVDLMEVTVTRN